MPFRKYLYSTVFILLINLISQEVFAQRFLVLEKMGTRKRYEYYEGDKFVYQLKDQNGFRTDNIVAIGDTALVLENGSVPFRLISAVDLRQFKGAWVGIGSTFIAAGVVLFAIDYINQAVVAGNSDPGIDKGVAIGSAILAGSGAAMIILANKKVKLKKNWRLRVVDIFGGS